MNTFNCQDARILLDQHELGDASPDLSKPLAAHLLGCAECRLVHERTLLMRHKLQAMPVPPPPAGYERRLVAMMRAAERPARATRWLPAYAMAASLALCVSVVLLLNREPARNNVAAEAPTEVAMIRNDQLQPVRLVFNSPRALSGVSLTVALPEGVELAARPGVRELTWTTDLQVGSNVLELPLLAHEPGGHVLATLRYGNAERRYSVALKAFQQSGLSPAPEAAQQTNAAPDSPASPQPEVISHA